MDLIVAIYLSTRTWPLDEHFGLSQHIVRAAIPVLSNIAEGRGRTGAREFLHGLSVAHGSLWEGETQIQAARRLEFLFAEGESELLRLTDEDGRLLSALERVAHQSVGLNFPG